MSPTPPQDRATEPLSSERTPERRRRGFSTRALRAIKVGHAAERTTLQRFADALARIASSAPFFTLHIVWFLVWILWNTGKLGFAPFDPYPFGFLTMVVSLEAIFLAIFVLMVQSREATIAELREELMLQVNLKMEQEVTKTLQLVAGLYPRLGLRVSEDADLMDMLQPLDPEGMERELMQQIEESVRGRHRNNH